MKRNNWLRIKKLFGGNWKKRLEISVCAGLLAALLGSGAGAAGSCYEPYHGTEASVRLAWWGTLYPKFCFQESQGTKNRRISFWLAKVLDW